MDLVFKTETIIITLKKKRTNYLFIGYCNECYLLERLFLDDQSSIRLIKH